MDFSLTEEQQMLRVMAERFVAGRPLAERLHPGGMSPSVRSDWQEVAGLGWTTILVPESRGGLGWTTIDATLIAEELGRGLLPVPFLSNGVIAPLLLTAEGALDASDLLAKLVEGESLAGLAIEEAGSRYDLASCSTDAARTPDGFVLSGRKILILDGGNADDFFVTARLQGSGEIALFHVAADAPGVRIRTYETIDGRSAADLLLEDVAIAESAMVLSPEIAQTVLSRVLDHARIVLAAEAVGAMDAVTALTADYLKQRKQFGRPLSEFQTLTHRLADMYVATEKARAMVFRALSLIGSPAVEFAAGVSATMIATAKSGEFVGGQAIQLHGGIGMSEEYVAGRYYKRLRTIAMTFGDKRFHDARYRALTWRGSERPTLSPMAQTAA